MNKLTLLERVMSRIYERNYGGRNNYGEHPDERAARLASHKARQLQVGNWNVIDTIHGDERKDERTNYEKEDHLDMLHKIHKVLPQIRNEGEYMFTSRSKNRSYVMNVAPKIKQMRVISIMPLGKHIAKQGTPKYFVEHQKQYIEIFVD